MVKATDAQLARLARLYAGSVSSVDLDGIEKYSEILKQFLIAERSNYAKQTPERAMLFEELKSTHEHACAVIDRLSELVRDELNSTASKERVSAYVTTQTVSEVSK